MKLKFAEFMMGILVFGNAYVFGLDIPLEGGGQQTGSMNLGYIDMEKIFQLYPKTLTAKEDYAKQLKAKRQELAKQEAELVNIKNKLSVLESTLKNPKDPEGPELDGSTATVTGDLDPGEVDPNFENMEAQEPQSLLNLRKELENKKAEFEEQKKRAQDDLMAFEKRQSQIILGNIYEALRDLAEEEQISIVVDKASVLYGAATIDLTDKLQNKLRGY